MKYLILLFLVSCTSVPVYDSEVCGDLGTAGASCFHTLTTDARDIKKADWDQERFGQLCITSQTFADIKASIEKLCSVSTTVRCSYEVKHMLESLQKKIDSVKP